MKILFGVQATGQGHISRARGLAEAFRHHHVDVTWLFSGRPRNQLFDMAPFGDFEHRTGLTFVTEGGRLRHRKTILNSAPLTFINDVKQLDLNHFDLIVTDYEPVTAWAAKLAGRSIIGIGHQYAFGSNTPVEGNSWIQRTVMQRFAPVTRPVGLHWAAFNENVLPPILDLPVITDIEQQEHVLVYLPFEDQELVTRWLRGFKDHRFKQYSNAIDDEQRGNVTRHRANIKGFKVDLASARGVICNSGFELISECLQWRKPVLTRPLKGQMEQLSNAAALESLGYARVIRDLEFKQTQQWLTTPPPPPTVRFHNVAQRLASWLAEGATTPVQQLSAELWR